MDVLTRAPLQRSTLLDRLGYLYIGVPHSTYTCIGIAHSTWAVHLYRHLCRYLYRCTSCAPMHVTYACAPMHVYLCMCTYACTPMHILTSAVCSAARQDPRKTVVCYVLRVTCYVCSCDVLRGG